jgi:hypothetical protein
MARKGKEKEGCDCGCGGHCGHGHGRACGGGCAYGLGLIGAAVYFIKGAATFGAGVIGFLKAVVWPAILVFEILKFLKI